MDEPRECVIIKTKGRCLDCSHHNVDGIWIRKDADGVSHILGLLLQDEFEKNILSVVSEMIGMGLETRIMNWYEVNIEGHEHLMDEDVLTMPSDDFALIKGEKRRLFVRNTRARKDLEMLMRDCDAANAGYKARLDSLA